MAAVTIAIDAIAALAVGSGAATASGSPAQALAAGSCRGDQQSARRHAHPLHHRASGR